MPSSKIAPNFAAAALPSWIQWFVWPPTRLRVFAAGLLATLVVTMFYLGSQPGASTVIPPPPWDKLAHFLVFGAYAGMAWVAFGGKARWWPLAVVLAIGGTDETLQAFSPGRSSDWTDVAADLAGGLVAVLVMNWLRGAVPGAGANRAAGGR